MSDPCGSYTPSDDWDQDITTTRTYDAAGNQLSARDPNGKETLYQYDGLSRLTQEQDALLHTTQYAYDALGNLLSRTDAKNVVTRYEYDALSRLTAVTENYKSGQTATHEGNVRTQYTYDAAGNRLAIQDGLNHTTTFSHDGLDRLTTEQDALDHTTTYGYDAAGNRVSVLDANGQTTLYGYDALNRLVSIDYPDPDADASFTYDAAGNRAGMSDGLGVTTWAYDALNWAIAVTDPFSGTVQYGYDGLGNRTSLTYPDAKNVTYAYDLAGNLHQATGWDSLATLYSYDKAGRPKTVELPNGVTTTYSFDDAGRLLHLTHASDVQLVSSYDYTYDEAGNRTSATEVLAQATASPPDLVSSDGFESGDLAGWQAGRTDGGDLRASQAAAIAGSFGLQADIDDNTGLYVADWTPLAETRYRARFYFDPNSIMMANGEAHYLFQGSNNTPTTVVRIELRSDLGDYQVRVEALNDNGSWTSSAWVTLSDQMHYLELDWRASGSPGANNGGLGFWLDGNQKANLTGLDNDTRRVDWVQLGAVSGIDNGTRGTYFFDAFESRRQTYLGADPNAPAPPTPPTPPDFMFADGFEAGNFSAWSAVSHDNGDLSVTAQAVITGAYGLQALLDDNNAIYVTDWRPAEETRYRARFYYDPNSITMAQGDAHYLFYALNRQPAVLARIELRFSYGDYQVRAEVSNDANGWSSTPWVTITDGPHALEIDWKAATAAGANNGGLTFWVDGVQKASFTTIDNDTRFIEYAQLGAVGYVDSGSRGTTYFDAFESRRSSYIGLAAAGWPRFQVAERHDPAALRGMGAMVVGVDRFFDLLRRPAEITPKTEVERASGLTKVLGAHSLAKEASRALNNSESTEKDGLSIYDNPLLNNLQGSWNAAANGRLALLTQGQVITTTITYTYDPLYRLTAATYGDGTYFRYTYDAAGNRLTEETTGATLVSSTYDSTDRLSSVDGVSYTWDDNGNLLSDGVHTYSYDHSNRLISVNGPGSAVSYAYNGLGDRISQTTGGTITHYTLDLERDLTQALSDDTNTYLYGTGRIAQYDTAGPEYFLDDALGSVRQMTNADGDVLLAKDYQPYGETLFSAGSVPSSYGFTGEWTTPVNQGNLVYLRARWYTPQTGRFMTKDIWEGAINQPISLNHWAYAYANPVNFFDPSGYLPLTILTDETKMWGMAEKQAIERAALDVGRALAKTVENYIWRKILSGCGKSNYPKISPIDAFIKVYGGPVTFTHSEKDENYWGESTGPQSITLYRAAKVIGNSRFIVHELGHSFENALEKILGSGVKPPRQKLGSIQSRNPAFPNRASKTICIKINQRGECVKEEKFVPNLNYGFAGQNIRELNGWQQSRDDSPGEEFADMYIGWVYNQWETIGGKLSGDGRARANFMSTYMQDWVWIAYSR